MNLLLLQSSVYLPSFGGGNKANRLLLEALAARGHHCASIAKSVDAQTVIDKTREVTHLSERGIYSRTTSERTIEYEYQGVMVHAVKPCSEHGIDRYARRYIEQMQPDLLLVSDDKSGELLNVALSIMPQHTVLILHTNFHLPFGAEATKQNVTRTQQYQQCQHRLCSTQYTQTYLKKTIALDSTYLPFPVFGSPPFACLGRFDTGYIGMINPCDVKGIDVFLGLAMHFSEQSFLAVPTWGATVDDIHAMKQCSNIQIHPPVDDIEVILKQLKILIVPSLIPETFGYVVVEAMLRGIPVLASDYGGLRDAKLGVNYLLPIKPALNIAGKYHIPIQDLKPWIEALQLMCHDKLLYRQCSEQSQAAAHAFVSTIGIAAFERYFQSVKSC